MTDTFFDPPPPAEAPTPVPWVEGPADDIVPELLRDASTLAETSQTQALTAIRDLANYRPSIPAISVPTVLGSAPSVSVVGTAPTEPPGFTGTFPVVPVEPTFGNVPTVELPTVPEFNVATPLIVDVPLPDPFAGVLPDSPVLSNAPIPVEPDFVLPEVPTLQSLNLPSAPVLDLPLFTDELDDGPTAPSVAFAWSEVEYQTTLLAAANGRLLDFVNGASTGLTPEVESAIWQRARDRETAITKRAVDEAIQIFAARGHTLPDGVVLRVVEQALQDSLERDSQLSRDIMVKQAELEQSNFHFAFGLAVQLESALIQNFNSVQNRAFEGQKFAFQAVVSIFNAQIALRQADVQAFGMKAQVFETRLKAKLAELDVYKAELEGQRTVSEINRNEAAVFQARIDGVRAVVEVYRARVEAVKAVVDADRNKAEIYRAQLQGYESLVKAKATEYDGYATRIKAEATKTEIFGQQVGAYKTRVDAYGTLVTSKLSEQNLQFRQLQEFPLELYKGRITAYGSGVQAEAARLGALANQWETRVRSFAAIEQAKSASDNVRVELYRADIAKYTAQAQVAIQASIENVRTLLGEFETISASLRANGQIAGQMTAAALSARHVSASISSNASNSASNSSSNSASNAASNSSSRSGSRADSASQSTSTSFVHNFEE